MPVKLRPKIPTIYNLVSGWWNNQGGVQFVAHAITGNGTRQSPAVAHLLADATETDGQGGGQPYNHPDQAFWRQNGIDNAIADAGGANAITRVEIDCSLLPCDNNQNSCLYKVPYAIQQILPRKPIRMYSHRLEQARVVGQASKRLLKCNANDDRNTLDTAMNNNEGWMWAPWNNLYS